MPRRYTAQQMRQSVAGQRQAMQSTAQLAQFGSELLDANARVKADSIAAEWELEAQNFFNDIHYNPDLIQENKAEEHALNFINARVEALDANEQVSGRVKNMVKEQFLPQFEQQIKGQVQNMHLQALNAETEMLIEERGNVLIADPNLSYEEAGNLYRSYVEDVSPWSKSYNEKLVSTFQDQARPAKALQYAKKEIHQQRYEDQIDIGAISDTAADKLNLTPMERQNLAHNATAYQEEVIKQVDQEVQQMGENVKRVSYQQMDSGTTIDPESVFVNEAGEDIREDYPDRYALEFRKMKNLVIQNNDTVRMDTLRNVVEGNMTLDMILGEDGSSVGWEVAAAIQDPSKRSKVHVHGLVNEALQRFWVNKNRTEGLNAINDRSYPVTQQERLKARALFYTRTDAYETDRDQAFSDMLTFVGEYISGVETMVDYFEGISIDQLKEEHPEDYESLIELHEAINETRPEGEHIPLEDVYNMKASDMASYMVDERIIDEELARSVTAVPIDEAPEAPEAPEVRPVEAPEAPEAAEVRIPREAPSRVSVSMQGEEPVAREVLDSSDDGHAITIEHPRGDMNITLRYNEEDEEYQFSEYKPIEQPEKRQTKKAKDYILPMAYYHSMPHVDQEGTFYHHGQWVEYPKRLSGQAPRAEDWGEGADRTLGNIFRNLAGVPISGEPSQEALDRAWEFSRRAFRAGYTEELLPDDTLEQLLADVREERTDTREEETTQQRRATDTAEEGIMLPTHEGLSEVELAGNILYNVIKHGRQGVPPIETYNRIGPDWRGDIKERILQELSDQPQTSDIGVVRKLQELARQRDITDEAYRDYVHLYEDLGLITAKKADDLIGSKVDEHHNIDDLRKYVSDYSDDATKTWRVVDRLIRLNPEIISDPTQFGHFERQIRTVLDEETAKEQMDIMEDVLRYVDDRRADRKRLFHSPQTLFNFFQDVREGKYNFSMDFAVMNDVAIGFENRELSEWMDTISQRMERVPFDEVIDEFQRDRITIMATFMYGAQQYTEEFQQAFGWEITPHLDHYSKQWVFQDPDYQNIFYFPGNLDIETEGSPDGVAWGVMYVPREEGVFKFEDAKINPEAMSSYISRDAYADYLVAQDRLINAQERLSRAEAEKERLEKEDAEPYEPKGWLLSTIPETAYGPKAHAEGVITRSEKRIQEARQEIREYEQAQLRLHKMIRDLAQKHGPLR